MEPMPFKRNASMPERKDALLPFVRAVIAQAINRLDRSVNVNEFAARTWPDDHEVPIVLRAASSPTLMAGATALTPISQAFVEALQPLTASGQLINSGISLTSFGRGLVTVPGFAPGESSFVAEGSPIPVNQFVSSGPTLSPYKLATIVTLSGELLDHSNAELLVRAALTESVAIGLDRKLFSADAATAAAPAGLLNGIAAITATAAGGAVQDIMASDIGKLLTAIAPVAGAGYMIVASPPQAVMLQTRLDEVSNVYASSALAAGTVIAIAPRAFVSIMETPRLATSFEALVHQDTVPAAIANGGGVAAPARSLFQTNAVGLRMITPVSWALRSPSAVAWTSSVNW